MAIHVNLVGRKDLKSEIYCQLRAAIRTGQLRAGEYLTPSRELAQAVAVSRSTVVAACDRLAGEGFVTSRSMVISSGGSGCASTNSVTNSASIAAASWPIL